MYVLTISNKLISYYGHNDSIKNNKSSPAWFLCTTGKHFIEMYIFFFFLLPKLPWPGYQNRFAVDPRIMGHPAAMAYNFNLLQPPNRGSPIPYSGVAHPSPLGLAQPSPDKEPSDPIRNGLPWLSISKSRDQFKNSNPILCLHLAMWKWQC